MKQKILLIIAILIIHSCYLFKENGIEVEIKNNSNTPITDIKFTTTENLNSITYKRIEKDESMEDFLEMKENRSDGSYMLEFKRINGKLETRGAGYYTNGGALDSRILCEIRNDTVYARTSDY